MKQKVDIKKNDEIPETDLLNHIRLSINPKFQDWVLFKNGTYIIFDNADKILDLESEAIRLMAAFGPVYIGTPAADFDVTDLNKTEGWIVSGHGYGMYTYVSPHEIKSNVTDITTIGLLGRAKRDLDGKNPVVLHISRK